MYVTVPFTNLGVPETGLSATIRIRDLSDNSLLVTDAAMAEVGDGWYKYNFTTYDANKDYAIRCDGSATLGNQDRYCFAGNENYIDDIPTVEGALDANEVLKLILAATTGSSAGAGTATFEYKSVDGITTRIRSLFDANGNRQITLLDAT